MTTRTKLILNILAVCAVLFASCQVDAANRNTPAEKSPNAIAGGINDFAFNLYGRIKDALAIKNAEGNLFFSPYSISTALAMTYTGARGATASEMAEVLCFPFTDIEKIASGFGSLQKQLQADPKTSGYQLSVANALWGQKGYSFLPAFIDLNKKYFGSGLTELDFAQSEAARKTINTWIEKQTKEKIKDLITPGSIDAMTRLVLTNAIYFKGDWASKFKTENTKEANFNVTADKAVKVQMMYQKADYQYGANDDMQVLQMPYKGDELSMLILLPKKAVLEKIESELNAKNLQSYLSLLHKQEIEVSLPKFKMTCGTVELKGILAQMGMKEAFSDAADFSGMSGKKDLLISNVMHKAFVEVNEEGTEAAAATAVGMRLTAVLAEPLIFRADRPFIFMIRDNRSQSILFMGRVVNPALES
jgi:serine protease inhibitor